MPHQQLVADVAGEVLPSGSFAYPLVVVLMPRRGGKTGLMLPTNVHRASIIPGARCWYTAQTGGDAGTTFREDWLPIVAGLGPRVVKPRLSNGSESFTMMHNAGRVAIFPPTKKALHGKDADAATVDEAWAFSRDAGAALMQAIKPAQLTRPMRQMWIISAGGDASSEWLLDWRELGRALTGPDQGVAYFEWHPPVVERPEGGFDLAPGVDLDDPAVWADTHPAVGHTVTLDALRDDRRVFGAAEFHRAYLDVFGEGTEARVLPAVRFGELGRDDVAVNPTDGAVVLAYDVAPESAHAAITLTQTQGDFVVTELIESRPGSEWVVDRVRQLIAKWSPVSVAAADVGSTVAVTRELRALGYEIDEQNERQQANAADQLLADVLASRSVYRPDPALRRAAGAAVKSIRGDGWRFTRRGSTAAPISPVVAMSLGGYVARGMADQRIVIGF